MKKFWKNLDIIDKGWVLYVVVILTIYILLVVSAKPSPAIPTKTENPLNYRFQIPLTCAEL